MEEEKKVTEEQAQEAPVETQEQQPAEQPKHSFSMFADAMDKAIEKGREAREKNLSERRAWLNDRDTINSYGLDSRASMYALRDYEELTGHEHPKAKLIIEDIKRLRPNDPLDESWRMFDALSEVYRDIAAEHEKRKAEREEREARGEQRRAELMEKLEPANHEMGIDTNPHKRQGFEE